MATLTIKLAPSILAADFARLGEQVREAEAAGADRIHVDVMDGHFVPNISMGALVVKALRPVTRLPLETHLMIEQPDRYAEAFAKAGTDTLLVHVENSGDLSERLQRLRSLVKKVGIVVNPETSVDGVERLLPEVDMVLVMTVRPGFGGQKFLVEILPKIRQVRALVDRVKPSVEIEVDGGIEHDTIASAAAAGANVFVAGSAVFGAKDGIAAGMNRLQAAVSV